MRYIRVEGASSSRLCTRCVEWVQNHRPKVQTGIVGLVGVSILVLFVGSCLQDPKNRMIVEISGGAGAVLACFLGAVLKCVPPPNSPVVVIVATP